MRVLSVVNTIGSENSNVMEPLSALKALSATRSDASGAPSPFTSTNTLTWPTSLNSLRAPDDAITKASICASAAISDCAVKLSTTLSPSPPLKSVVDSSRLATVIVGRGGASVNADPVNCSLFLKIIPRSNVLNAHDNSLTASFANFSMYCQSLLVITSFGATQDPPTHSTLGESK